MSSRNISLRRAEEPSPRALISSNANFFNKAFNEGLGVEDWDDWMRWEGATTELLPTAIEHRQTTETTISSPETWAMGVDPTSVDYSAVTGFQFEDAPFELDETPSTPISSASNYNFPGYPLAASYSTQIPTDQDLPRSFRGFCSLTEAEERSLQDIAMPYHALSNIKIALALSSPMESLSPSLSPSPEPEVRTRKKNKRKSIDLGGLPSSTLCQSRKRGHNAIEKRYRTNLNAKIENLREGVPALPKSKSSAQKYGKAAVLMRALEYIQHLEKTAQRLGSEVDAVKTRVGAFERLAMGGSYILNGNGMDIRGRPNVTKSETLESIQDDFKQIKPKVKAVT